MAARCHYAVLGVALDASADTIRKAYKELALRHHPDKNNGEGTEKFKEILAAYEVPAHAIQRRRHRILSQLRLRCGEADTHMQSYQYLATDLF